MYKDLIFDFGQVIVHFDPIYMTSRYVKDENDINLVADVVFDRLYWDKLDMGTITDDEVVAGICERLPERLHNAAVNVYNNWYENLPLIDGAYELLKELKTNGNRLFLLSNISIGFADNYHNNPVVKNILDMFDGLVFSGKLGIVKPNAEIFDYTINKYNINKSAVVFIDDNINNINGAKSYGIDAYLFDGDYNKLRSYLK